jgi:hypothetical protein
MNVRKGMGLAAVGMGLALAVPVQAQRDGASFFTGVRPSDIVYKPIDLSNAVAPVPQQNTDKFSLRRYLSKVIPGLSPTPGATLTPSLPTVPGATTLPAMKPIAPPVMPKR